MRQMLVACSLLLLSCVLWADERPVALASGVRPDFVVMLTDNAGRVEGGHYHFTLQTSPRANLKRAWLLVARSATPDFQAAPWQEVPMQDSPLNATNIGQSMTFREADVPVGPAARKYLAVKGEVEIEAADGTLKRYASALKTYPSLHVWSLPKADGSRDVYAQPSEPGAEIRMWTARSATREFQKAKWQAVPLTAPQARSWDNHSARLAASGKKEPYLAVYAEMIFGGASQSVKITSPRIIWNGVPWLSDPTKIQTNVCPLHGSADGVVPVIYGLPGAGAPRDAVFAGCIVGPGSPSWHCKRCDRSWGDAMRERSPQSSPVAH